MTQPTVFYSWQSDLPRASTRDIIRNAASIAVSQLSRQLSLEDSPRLDHDTMGESGTPSITDTIFRKSKNSAVFVADVTLVGDTGERTASPKKRLSNPNVLVELGYAAAILGWDRVVLIMNKHYGSPQSLPFDLRHRRFPVTFDLGPDSKQRRARISSLAGDIEAAIATCLAAEYARVEEVLSRISAYARSLITEHGGSRYFWEKQANNSVLARLDLAISQLLDLGVIQCVNAATESGLAYAWTYLGRQCVQRLGAEPQRLELRSSGDVPSSVVVDMSTYDSISDYSPGYGVDVRVGDHLPPARDDDSSLDD